MRSPLVCTEPRCHSLTRAVLPRRSARRVTLRRGSTVVLVMIFLVLFTTLAISFSAASNMNLQQARNYKNMQGASLAAESGLEYLLAIIQGVSMPKSDAEADLIGNVAELLAARLDATPNVGSGEVTYVSSVIHVPTIRIDSSGQSFSADISAVDEANLLLKVTGSSAGYARSVSLQIGTKPGTSGVFDYGIASRSKISMTGNASVQGVNNPREGDILSATYTDPEAVKIIGNCNISGDISTSNPDSYVSITGNARIGGETSWDDIQKHLHIGVGNVEFPEVDQTVFEPFATNIVDNKTNTNGNKTFENIRIKAGTNPTFSGNITLKGVIFIEQPNSVRFTGNLNLTGVVVTEDAGDNAYTTNVIDFAGNVNSQGVEALPDTAQFHELRKMPGSMLLAPGFGVKFAGNFGTANGTMAADKFTFVGNAGGIVRGSIICYSDSEFSLTGNAGLRIDRSKYTGEPPGFGKPTRLVALSNTYKEY